MYSINRQETINPDFDMINRIVDKLNSKFDPNDAYHHSNAESEMFEFQMKIDDKRREAWQIVFMGHHTVASGSFFGFDYSDCQEEEYITLEEKNERKIYMLAVSNTVNVITKFIEFISMSDTSYQNKKKWIDTLKKCLEDEE